MQGVDIETALDWRGRTVVDRDGEKIGTLEEIYLDDSERPTWGSIQTGLFGLRQSLAPLSEAQLDGEHLRLPYERGHVTDAPNVDPDVQLTVEEEERLYRHYGRAEGRADEQPDRPGDGGEQEIETEPGAVAATRADRDIGAQSDRSETGQETDDAMTRSEEEVRIGKRVRERGRVRLKKYVVTDYVEKKVPVRREEVRLEREPPEGTERDAPENTDERA